MVIVTVTVIVTVIVIVTVTVTVTVIVAVTVTVIVIVDPSESAPQKPFAWKISGWKSAVRPISVPRFWISEGLIQAES